MPPAALVSTTVRQPADTAVRTPCTTAAGDSPSYRCTRPRNTRTRTGPATTMRTLGVCPGTVEAGNPPSSVSGISVSAAPIASAAGVQPEPRTTAASGQAGQGGEAVGAGRRGGKGIVGHEAYHRVRSGRRWKYP